MKEGGSRRKRISRRDLLTGGALASAGLALSKCLLGRENVPASTAQDATPTHTTYLPYVNNEPTPTPTPTPTNTPTPTPTATPTPGASTGPKVLHIRNPDATHWNGSGWYGDAVNQTAVNGMVQDGLQNLTNQSSWMDIWNDLFSQVQPSGYHIGQKIAIKVNFNNSRGCDSDYTEIDALPQPIKALIAGLVEAGVAQEDIWVYDATGWTGKTMPVRFRNPILASYPGVQFYGNGDCDDVNTVSHGGHDSLTVHFTDPHGYLQDRFLANVLYDATYVINVPILKAHGIHPVTLGFKNHFGSLNVIIRPANDDLHNYIRPSHELYDPAYSPLVDIFQNPNIKDKTILTMGDALYGAFGARSAPPTSWNTFGDAPNSLFFSKDPVAIDCVLIDFLAAEGKAHSNAYDYLFVAQSVGLGVCEGTPSNPGGDPWQTPYGSGYGQIQYIRRDL